MHIKEKEKRKERFTFDVYHEKHNTNKCELK